MKIGVTAANGKLGSSVVDELVKEIGRENVIGIVRTPEKASHLGVELKKGDYNNREDFISALKGIDSVLLISGMDDPQKRIQQHRNVIEAARENGVKKIGYTSRGELGFAYAQMLLQDNLEGQTYNLVGEAITQTRLAELINQEFSTKLKYNPITVDVYEEERKAELGDFIGTVIAGIYHGIKKGVNDVRSDFERVAGRPHKSMVEMMKDFKS